jgi:O-antigen/teichoic acid export membrane protein
LLAALIITMFFKGYSSGTHPSTYYKIVAQNPSRKFFRQMLDYGIPITIWALISNFYNVSDRFIIKYFNGFEAVGIYGSVYDLVYKVCGFMTLPVLLAYHPALSASWGNQEYNNSRGMIYRAVFKVTAITVFVFIIIYLFRDFIFGMLFRTNIPVLDELFVPIALSSILWQVTLIIQKPLEFNMKRTIMIRGIVITVFINALLNFISIPVFGYEAAAYNTFISTLFYFLYVIYFSRNELNKFIVR